MPPLTKNLLGADLAVVCALLGPPLSCSHGDGVLRLTYPDGAGRPRAGAVELADGVVVAFAGDLHEQRAAAAGLASRGRELAGWPIESVVQRFGSPRRSIHDGGCCIYEFDDVSVLVHEGTVAMVTRSGGLATVAASSGAEPV